MKNKIFNLAVLFAAVYAAGCDKEPTASQQIDRLNTQTKAAAQNMKDYTFAQKAEFTKAMEGQLADINKGLDQLSAKIEGSSDAVKAEAKPKLQALRAQAAKLNAQLDDDKNATESTWDAVKAASNKAFAELTDGFNQSRQWVSDRIAP